MKIAVVIPTYYKPDGSTFGLVQKTIDSVNSQSHKDWHLFLIGDKYENIKEFNKIGSQVPIEKITKLNLPIAKEREKYKDNKQALWNTGGVNANNVGIEVALLCGFDYIAHLDHDDLWESNHLEEINKCIELTKSIFICTKASYKKNVCLPNLDFKEGELYKEFYPNMAKQIHSSICVNFKKIKSRYVDMVELKGEMYPSDGILSMYIHNELKENGYLSTCINVKTVVHDTEGETLTS